MKVPKYIVTALEQRARAAVAFEKADQIISEFIDKNEIGADPADYHHGAESLFAPWESVERVIEAINVK